AAFRHPRGRQDRRRRRGGDDHGLGGRLGRAAPMILRRLRKAEGAARPNDRATLSDVWVANPCKAACDQAFTIPRRALGPPQALPEECSSMARAPVSKTGGWGFESLHSCQA